jgi:hypothetical protein
MATLSLEGRVLTLTDDNGNTSSVDLSEVKGDIGVRGVQGIAGSSVDLSDYYTKAEIDELLPPSAEGVKY